MSLQSGAWGLWRDPPCNLGLKRSALQRRDRAFRCRYGHLPGGSVLLIPLPGAVSAVDAFRTAAFVKAAGAIFMS